MRRLLSSFVALGIVVLLAGCVPWPVPPIDGTAAGSFEVNAGHTGVSRTTISPRAVRRWAQVFPNGFVHTPIIIGNRVFAPIGYFGDPTQTNGSGYAVRIVAFDRRTGAILWNHLFRGLPDDNEFFTQLTYESGRLFTLNGGGVTRALDPATGRELWKRRIYGQFTSAPTAYGGSLYIYGYFESYGRVWALDQATGNTRWEFRGDFASGGQSSPAVTQQTVFINSACNQTYAIHRSNGTQLWHHPANCFGGGGTTPAVSGNRVFLEGAGLDGLILNAATGSKIGSFAYGLHAAVGSTAVYLSDRAHLEARDLVSNRLLWTHKYRGVLTSAYPVLAHDVLYNITDHGQMAAISAKTGATLSVKPLGVDPDNYYYDQFASLNVGEATLLVPVGDHLIAFS